VLALSTLKQVMEEKVRAVHMADSAIRQRGARVPGTTGGHAGAQQLWLFCFTGCRFSLVL
jgi:hypothetical protein